MTVPDGIDAHRTNVNTWAVTRNGRLIGEAPGTLGKRRAIIVVLRDEARAQHRRVTRA